MEFSPCLLKEQCSESLASFLGDLGLQQHEEALSQHTEYRDVQSYAYFSHHSHAEAAAFTSWLSEKGVPPFHGFRIKKAVKESMLKTAHQATLPAAGLDGMAGAKATSSADRPSLRYDLRSRRDPLEILDRTPLMYLSR